ncbi:M protein [Durusdinium trenchii]|uniref:Serotype 5 n=1 Tax=Durusdinium trenchii TaxID=1381693 RepID=A0ABP0QQC4_9DINO
MNLQCDTPYNARLRAVCLPAAASSDWMAFPSFRTSYAGSCLVPATAPQLLRAARSTPSMLEICFTAGAAGDCVFSGFELQMQMEGSSWMDLPVTCGSLAVREGPCCSVMNLLEGTGYFFRARETCSNGAPLASPFVTSEVALYTTSVPEVPPPSYRDPLGVITTLEAPNRLMLFFEADLQLGASDVPIRVCPALVGTAEAPGPCQCVSEADCASRCAERQDLSALLMSARVLLVDLGSAVEPLTSCTYEVTVEEGFLVTQLEPRKASPRVVWNFTHVPPAPTGSLSLHSSTETSLVVHVTYDLPVTVQCGVLTGEGVAHLAPAEDFTGARSFVEIRITGLEPFTQYTVTCTGVVIGNPALNSTVTQAGLSTLVDTDDTLSGITLVVEALCDGDGAFVQPIDAAFFPPFSPENRQYQLSLDAEEMRTTWCSEDSVEAVVRIQLQGTSTSIFARVTNPQAQVLRQELRDATTGQLPEDVSPNAVVQVSIVVDPAQLGATAPAPYVVEVVLGVLDVRVESHSFPALVEDDTTDTESGDSASLVLSVPVGLTASELNFLLGPHQQQATLSSSEAAPQQEGETVPRILLTFDFASLVGMGDGLPLIIQIQPAAGSSTRVVNIYTQISVSFAAPTVITVETTQVNNLVSLTEITFVTITGANLALADEPLQLNAEIFIASIPPTCDDSECRAAELQRLVSDGLGENLCQSTVVLSTTSLSCNVAPSASASLGLCLVLRGGLFSNYYCAATFPEALQPQQVTVTGVNTPEQEASSPEPIIVTESGELENLARAVDLDKQHTEQKLESIRHENHQLQTQLEELKTERAALRAQLDAEKQQRQSWLTESSAMMKEVQMLRQRLRNSQEESGRWKSESKNIEEEFKALQQQQKDEEQKQQALQEKVARGREALETERLALSQLQQSNRSKEAESGSLERERQRLAAEVARVFQEGKKLEQQIGRQGTSTAALQSRLKALQQEVHRWKGRAKQQDAEACALRQKLKEMEAAKGHTGAPATATETATEGAKDHVSGQKIEQEPRTLPERGPARSSEIVKPEEAEAQEDKEAETSAVESKGRKESVPGHVPAATVADVPDVPGVPVHESGADEVDDLEAKEVVVEELDLEELGILGSDEGEDEGSADGLEELGILDEEDWGLDELGLEALEKQKSEEAEELGLEPSSQEDLNALGVEQSKEMEVWVSPFDEPAEDFADPGPGYFPLCADAVVLEDRRSIECYRNQDLNISELGTDLNVYVQTGQYQTSSNVLEGAIQLLLPEIIRVTRNHEYEVGELIVTIDGRHFGTAENGNMVVSVQSFGASSPVVEDPRLAEGFGDPSYTVQCETISHTDTQIVSRCTSTQTNSILGAQVEASLYTETAQLEVDESQGRRLQTTLDELALQLSQLPVAFSVGYQLECSVALRLNQSCDEPVAQTREWQSVRLRPCPAGEHRISYAGVGCLQCLPGYYKSGVGPALFCDPCELGFYMGLTGAGACTPCPPHETTQNTSSREIAACDCAENYFRRNSSVDWTLASNHGVCEPCPYGAICEGGSVLPYSAPGFWTPDRLVFWSCFPDFACLQGNADDPNLCQEGRVPHGRRCGRCAAQTYVHLSECRLCGLADRVLAWVGPFLVPLLTVLIFLPLLIRLLRSNDMARTKRSKTLIKQRGKTRNSMLGHLGDDHGEFRMLVVMWTTLQTLWICHEMPLNFTRFTRDWLWALGVTAWDFSILRPQCAYEISFVWKWLLQWLGFFVMIAFTLLCIWIYTCIHRNANRDYYYISPSQGLLGMLSINFMILLLVHLRDDLIFLQCIDCEDGKLCLAEQPAIECRLGDWEWSTMLVISLMDIFIVIVGCAYMIVLGVYKSWRWQHGNLPGLCSNAEIPWYVLFADLWVRGYIGYIKEIREAVPEFQQEYPHLESEEKRKEVWNKAIDLILAQEAEKAEILLHRLVQHLYRHHPRFRVIGEDEGPALQLVKAITSSYTSERSVKAQNEVLGRAEDGVDSSLKVADVHHVELMMNNLLDYARWTLPGCRAVKRVFAYSWAVVLLFQRFAIVIFCMLMPQDQDFAIPLTYLLVKLVSLLAEASLHPYVWTFLNDWEPWSPRSDEFRRGRVLIYVFEKESLVVSHFYTPISTMKKYHRVSFIHLIHEEVSLHALIFVLLGVAPESCQVGHGEWEDLCSQ